MNIITKKEAEKKIEENGAFVEGLATGGDRWPDEPHFWVLTDPADQVVYHVAVDEAPELGKA